MTSTSYIRIRNNTRWWKPLFLGNCRTGEINFSFSLTSTFEDHLYSFPVVEFLESWLRIPRANFLWKRKSWSEWSEERRGEIPRPDYAGLECTFLLRRLSGPSQIGTSSSATQLILMWVPWAICLLGENIKFSNVALLGNSHRLKDELRKIEKSSAFKIYTGTLGIKKTFYEFS